MDGSGSGARRHAVNPRDHHRRHAGGPGLATQCCQSYLAPYTASKAALAALTRNRLCFNGIAWAWMDTPEVLA